MSSFMLSKNKLMCDKPRSVYEYR